MDLNRVEGKRSKKRSKEQGAVSEGTSCLGLYGFVGFGLFRCCEGLPFRRSCQCGTCRHTAYASDGGCAASLSEAACRSSVLSHFVTAKPSSVTVCLPVGRLTARLGLTPRFARRYARRYLSSRLCPRLARAHAPRPIANC